MIISPGAIIFDGDRNEYKVLDNPRMGGMGVVYKIESVTNGSIWALKTLPTTFTNARLLEAFKNESQIALSISHKNIIKYLYIHDGIEFSEFPPYIIMEFADQGTLKDIIDTRKSQKRFFDPDELVNYYNQLIDGMKAINEKIVHRDVKPENVLIAKGVLKISDFGIAKIIEDQTRTHTFKGAGTFQYMSPEAWSYEKNEIQMDIYSMGIVFFEMATLAHPLQVEEATFESWREAHLFGKPAAAMSINRSLPLIISQMLSRMLQKKKNDRYESWDDVKAILEKNVMATTPQSSAVEDAIRSRIEKDRKISEELTMVEEDKKQKDDYFSLIKFQFEDDVIQPLKTFINEFNEKYDGKNIHTKKEYEGPRAIGYSITMVSGSHIVVVLKPLWDDDFYRARTIDDFGMRREIRELRRPKYFDRKILAWGFLKADEGKGINILLVEKKNELYGEWYVLINTNQATSSRPRHPEPFPFEFEEFEREVTLINAYHIYVTKYDLLSDHHLTNFMKEYI